MKKRAISVILAALMLLTVAVPALADEENTSTVTVSTLVEPIYEDARGFNEGFAAVKKDGKWGYIDETGKVVIDFKYDYAGDFSEGYALVIKTVESEIYYTSYDYAYIIDEAGNETPLQWKDYDGEIENFMVYGIDDLGTPFFNYGVLVLQGSAFGTDGMEITPNDDDLHALADKCESNGLTGFIYKYTDEDGKEVTEYECYASCANVCVDGLIPMYLHSDYDYAWICFLMDKNGHIVRDFSDMAVDDWDNDNVKLPDGILAPVDGYMVLGIWDGVEYTTGYGVMDYATGSWAVQPKYTGYRYSLSGSFFLDGLWIVTNQEYKYGAVDKTGKEVIPLEYDFLDVYNKGLSAVSKDGEWFYIDTYGNRYEVGLPGGGTAKNLAVAGSFGSSGVAAVYDRDSGKGYLITSTPVDGVLPAVEGGDGIALSTYFPGFDGTVESISTTISPGEYVTFEEDGKYGFYKLTFDLVGQNPFSDVLPGAYYYDEVVWAANEEIVDTSVDTFQPKAECPRWQVVDSLWRAADCPEPTVTETAFEDVAPEVSYYKAVLWASENGIANGTSDTTFSPDATVKRCDALTFLWRAAGKPETEGGTEFTDVSESDYFIDAVSWAVSQSTPIAQGVGDGKFDPKNQVVKCDMMIFLYRTIEEDSIDLTVGAAE